MGGGTVSGRSEGGGRDRRVRFPAPHFSLSSGTPSTYAEDVHVDVFVKRL